MKVEGGGANNNPYTTHADCQGISSGEIKSPWPVPREINTHSTCQPFRDGSIHRTGQALTSFLGPAPDSLIVMSTVKKAALVCGAIFLLLGIFGFIPELAPAGLLFGLFHADKAYNLVHLLTGAIGAAVGLIGTQASRLYFQVIGLVYVTVALLALLLGGRNLLAILADNAADALLHGVVAVAALYFGFVWAEDRHAGSPVQPETEHP